MNPFLAMIIPMGGGQGIWGGGNVPMPTPPIQMPPGGGQQPPGIWGGGNQPFPTPPINMPPGSGRPEHPIYNPPGFWGGGNVPMPNPPIELPPDPNAEGWEEVYIQGMGWTKIIKKEDAKQG